MKSTNSQIDDWMRRARQWRKPGPGAVFTLVVPVGFSHRTCGRRFIGTINDQEQPQKARDPLVWPGSWQVTCAMLLPRGPSSVRAGLRSLSVPQAGRPLGLAHGPDRPLLERRGLDQQHVHLSFGTVCRCRLLVVVSAIEAAAAASGAESSGEGP